MTGEGAGPAPMEGHGTYNRSSRVQAAGLAHAIPLLQRAAGAVPLPPVPEPVVIADYGASQGLNSLAPMSAAIHGLRARVGAERPVSVMHTDLPDNDFAALFQVLNTDEASYLHADPASFAFAVGRSFYGQILPPGSVSLGWSSWAVQWLSRTPGPIPDQVQVSYSRDAAAREAYARQAASDWETFLAGRSAELRPGGRLVVVTMALTDDGAFGYRSLLEAIYGSLEDMVAAKDISGAELRRMAIPTVARSRDDMAAPFRDGVTPGGLTIEHLEIFDEEDRIWNTFQADRDARAFGAAWAAFSRASVFPTLALGLETGGDAQRTSVFIADLERRVAARLAAAPEAMRIPLAAMVMAKQGA